MKKSFCLSVLVLFFLLTSLPAIAAGKVSLLVNPPTGTYKRTETLIVAWQHPSELVGKEVATTIGLVKPGDILRWGGVILKRIAPLTNSQETVSWVVPADYTTGDYSLLVEEHEVSSPNEPYFDWIDVQIDPSPASVLMMYSPLEIFRVDAAKFKFTVKGAPSENFVLGILKEDGVPLGWIVNIAELKGEQGEINWDFSQYLTPDLGEYRIAPAGDGYSIQIGVVKDYIGLSSRPDDIGLFVASTETVKFKILPNTSNLFIRHTRSPKYEWLSFAVLGQPGERYTLQESTDLISWEPLGSPTGLEGEKLKPEIKVESFGLGKLVISRDNRFGNRFYRAVLSGP